ncbi:MAG: hypothetical protein Q9164_002854 [Protoblastenia rupestris]
MQHDSEVEEAPEWQGDHSVEEALESQIRDDGSTAVDDNSRTWDASGTDIEGTSQDTNVDVDPYLGSANEVTTPPPLTRQERREEGNKSGRVSDPWQVPFGIRHYFMEFLRATLEACFQQYVREHLPKAMNPDSLRFWLRYHDDQIEKDALTNSNWNEMVDIPDSVLLLKLRCVPLPPESLSVRRESLDRILDRVFALRQNILHRHREVSVNDIVGSMALPTALNDDVRTEQLERIWNRISEYSPESDTASLEQEIREAFESAAYPAEASQMTGHQLIHKIITLLEAPLFALAQKTLPDLLQEHEWTRPEQVETGHWLDLWEKSPPASVKWDDLKDMLHGVRLMRNAWAHRNIVDEYTIHPWIHNAMRLAMFLGDYEQAVEIEILAEQWFEGTSRHNVLKRLRDVYLSDQPTSTLGPEDIRKRQMAITNILAAMSLASESEAEVSPIEKSSESSKPATSDPDVFREDISPQQQSAQVSEWPASMHPALKVIKPWGQL